MGETSVAESGIYSGESAAEHKSKSISCSIPYTCKCEKCRCTPFGSTRIRDCSISKVCALLPFLKRERAI